MNTGAGATSKGDIGPTRTCMDTLAHKLHRAAQAADALFEHNLEGIDLTSRQYAVLRALERKRDASQAELVEATGIDRSTLGDIVKRLVERGLLAKRRSRTDGRAYSIQLTRRGEKVLSTVLPVARKVDEHILGQVRPELRSSLLEALSTIAEEGGGAP